MDIELDNNTLDGDRNMDNINSKIPNRYTWLGIVVSIIGITSINLIFKSLFGGQLNDWQMVIREVVTLSLVAALLFYILPKEGADFESIGLHGRHWLKSLLWVIPLIMVSVLGILGCLEIAKLIGWKFGESTSFDLLSKPVIALITVRAGIAEEIFTRGFLLERFTSITGKKWKAFLLSTIPFGLLHYQQGYAGILVAIVAGAILALFYFWKRDLKTNIIAHFLIDFVPNVFLN